MKKSDTLPVYSKVALDIATKIAAGDLQEDTKFSGRSLMSTQYGVSQETIRRALNVLAEMGIVSIQQNSGAVVLSKQRAVDYIKKAQATSNMRSLKRELRNLIAERSRLDDRILDIVNQITDLNDRFTSSDPLRNYEFELSPYSKLVGKTIRESRFWQNTQTTIVAIISNGKTYLSPGPNAVFKAYDILVVAGTPKNLDLVRKYIQ